MKYWKIIISLILVAILISQVNVAEILEIVSKINIYYFVLAFGLCLLHLASMGVRWHSLISTTLNSKFLYDIYIYFQASFMNSFTPANIGGDSFRLIKYKAGDKTVKVINLLIVERVLGLIGYLTAYAFVYASFTFIDQSIYKTPLTFTAFLLALGGSVALISLPLFVKFFSNILTGDKLLKIKKILQDVVNFSVIMSWEKCLTLMLQSYLGLFLWITASYTVAQGLGSSVTLFQIALIVPLVEIIRQIPITLQGIGLRESVYAYAFTLIGLPSEEGLLVGTITYAILSCALFSCGITFLPSLLNIKKNSHRL